MSLSQNFGNIRPTLLLDFANVGRLDPRVTFTRATTATYYDANTSAVAEQNLLLQSQALTTSPWTVTSLNAVGSKTAPDGTATAIEITATATNGRTRQTVTVVSGQTYTHSMFVRRVTGSGNVTLAILDSGGTALFSTVMSLTSDWQRFTVSGAPAVTSIQAGIIIATSTDAVEVWGAQLEQRSAATAYTATTTQAITNYIPVLQTAAAGVPRFDYNPTTRAALGLLIEEQRTNLLLQSEDFATTWAATNVTVSTNATTAPNGTATADKLIANTTPAVQHYISQTISTATNQTYTFTCFIKNNEVAQFVIQIVAVGSTATTSNIGFTQTAGVIAWDGGLTGIVSSVSATSVGNGWYRCSVTYTLNGTVTLHQNRIFPGSVTNYAGDGTSGVFAWGAQNEAGAFATSYIPTTTTALTRNADVASMTGTNFSSWYNAVEGVLFAQAQSIRPGTDTTRIVAISDNTANNSFRLNAATTTNAVVASGNTEASFNLSYTVGAVNKWAIAYKSNDANGAVNGVVGTTDTSVVIPTVDRMEIGRLADGFSGSILVGHIQRIAYYPTRLSNTQLQALTG